MATDSRKKLGVSGPKYKQDQHLISNKNLEMGMTPLEEEPLPIEDEPPPIKYRNGHHPNSRKNLEMGMARAGMPSINPAGKPKGTLNRATILKRFADMLTETKDPSNPNARITVTLHEKAALGQFQAAANGSTKAWKEIQDSIYGKQRDKIEATVETVMTRVILPPLTDEEKAEMLLLTAE